MTGRSRRNELPVARYGAQVAACGGMRNVCQKPSCPAASVLTAGMLLPQRKGPADLQPACRTSAPIHRRGRGRERRPGRTCAGAAHVKANHLQLASVGAAPAGGHCIAHVAPCTWCDVRARLGRACRATCVYTCVCLCTWQSPAAVMPSRRTARRHRRKFSWQGRRHRACTSVKAHRCTAGCSGRVAAVQGAGKEQLAAAGQQGAHRCAVHDMAVTCRARQDGLVPRELADAGQPAIRLHEVDWHLGQALVKAGLESLDVPAAGAGRGVGGAAGD